MSAGRVILCAIWDVPFAHLAIRGVARDEDKGATRESALKPAFENSGPKGRDMTEAAG